MSKDTAIIALVILAVMQFVAFCLMWASRLKVGKRIAIMEILNLRLYDKRKGTDH